MHAKDQVAYWMERLKKRESGSGKEVSGYCSQILAHGVRRWYNTGTNNKSKAAQIVRDFWVSQLRDKGWPEKDTTDESEENKPLTVGSYLQAVDNAGSLPPKTLEGYSNKLRTLAAQAVLKEPSSIKGRRRSDWYAKIDAIPLSKLTQDTIREWRKNRVRSRSNPTAQKSANIACNSILRSCAALFRPRVTEASGISLPPEVAWASGRKERLEQTKCPRYVSRFEASTIFSAAEEHLKKTDPDSYRIILLALGAGLRRSEIDRLRWEDIDETKGRIIVRSSEYGTTKTLASEGEVHVHADLIKELGSDSGGWVVSPSHTTKTKFYRSDRAFRAATKWLRSQGVEGRCPLHTLRKEFGSHICANSDIFSASVQLRHSSLQVTRDHYLDQKVRFIMPLG